jgi:hypothetical protein
VDGKLSISDEGVTQNSGCRPIIANIFAHEVIDEWMEKMVKPHCVGQVKMLRILMKVSGDSGEDERCHSIANYWYRY